MKNSSLFIADDAEAELLKILEERNTHEFVDALEEVVKEYIGEFTGLEKEYKKLTF